MIISIILIISIFPNFIIQNTTADLNNPSILINHGPIYINGNNQFLPGNGVMSGSGILGDPYIIENFEINASIDHGIFIENTNVYFEIRNCYVYNGSQGITSNNGIYFNKVENGSIIDCRLINNEIGIYLDGCKNIFISNNSLINNSVGIYLNENSDNNDILDNNLTSNTFGGIRIRQLSDNNTIFNNIFINNNGVEINVYYFSCYNEIKNNSITNKKRSGTIGLSIFYHSNYNKIIENICSDSQYGIGLGSWSNFNLVENNTCYNNKFSINMIRTDSNRIINNSIYENDMGIMLIDCDRNVFSNNTINSSKNAGINLSTCLDNLFFNNYLNNSNNYYLGKFVACKWNITKTLGRNIIGGPYLGGNYWSGYHGRDTGNDGLGDTKTPHGPGDSLPLTNYLLPTIVDNTSGIPSTGDEFCFEAFANDDISIKGVYLDVHYDHGPHLNLTMKMTSGNCLNGTYIKLINISSNATKLYYNLSVTDTGYNWVSTSVKILNVTDNDKPTLMDKTKGYPINGEIFDIKVTANDNINISNVFVQYFFDNGVKYNKSLLKQDTFYNITIHIPKNAKILEYELSANDTSNNWAALEPGKLDVIDEYKPEIIDLSSIPTTGDNFNLSFQITDNIDLQRVFLEYWFDNGFHEKITLPETFIYPISILDNAFTLNYIVKAIDTSDNELVLEFNKSIKDNDSPIIQDLTTSSPETGNDFKVLCSVIENRMIDNVTMEYWFDDKLYENGEMILRNKQYELKIEVPENANKFNYKIIAKDTGNNSKSIKKQLDVIDTISPTILDQTSGPPTTGDEFEIKASINDNIAINLIYLEYWCDEYDIEKITFSESFIINIPIDGEKLYYQFIAFDKSNNKKTLEKELLVLDNDVPLITDNTRQPTTGDEFIFEIRALDNIGVGIINLEYWFDNGNHNNLTYTGNENHLFYAPINARILYYTISALDGNCNKAILTNTLSVLDNDKPFILDFSPKLATTGDEFNISAHINDNILVTETIVEYWIFDEHFKSTVELIKNNFTFSIVVPSSATLLKYSISAWDSSNNELIVEKTIAVIDNDKPIINDHSFLLGNDYYFLGYVNENIELKEAEIEYQFDNTSFKHKILISNDHTFNNTIKISKNVTKLFYIIKAVDTSNNSVSTPLKEIEIKHPFEVKANKEVNNSFWWLLLILFLIILIITILIFYKRRYRFIKSKK